MQQLMTQARLTELWGWGAFSHASRNAMQAALARMEQLVTRMLYHGLTPNATQLAPARVGRSRVDMLEINWQTAQQGARLYEEAARFCARQRATDEEALFRALLDEHVSWLRQIETDLAALRKEGGS